ncbi:MAG: hypothetical protein RR540_07735 [Oscillospiraceae bacterium]
MPKICPCGTTNADNAAVCGNCGKELTPIENSPAANPAPTSTQNPAQNQQVNMNRPPMYSQPPQNNRPPMQQVPPQYYQQKPVKKNFAWNDICTLIGFVSSILGIFWCSIILLPVGVICSILGFKGNRTKKLAVAGAVISVIAVIICICIRLYESGIIPSWVTNGIF